MPTNNPTCSRGEGREGIFFFFSIGEHKCQPKCARTAIAKLQLHFGSRMSRYAHVRYDLRLFGLFAVSALGPEKNKEEGKKKKKKKGRYVARC